MKSFVLTLTLLGTLPLLLVGCSNDDKKFSEMPEPGGEHIFSTQERALRKAEDLNNMAVEQMERQQKLLDEQLNR